MRKSALVGSSCRKARYRCSDIFAGNELVAVYNRSSTGTNTLTYVLSDHHGSFAHLVTSTGTNDVAESFTAYGNRRSGTTWSGSPSSGDETAINAVSRWGYTGETVLGVSLGLIDLNGRVEDAVTGRFLSADPYVQNMGDSQNFNRYSYVNNNPLTFIDPSGFTKCRDGCDSNGNPSNQYQPPDGYAPMPSGPCDPDCRQGALVTAPPLPNQTVLPGFDYGGGSGGRPSSPGGGGAGGHAPQTIPCSAANSSGNGLIVQLAYTDAHSSFGMTVPDANHTFVIVSDPSTGASYASRGGPGSGPGGGPGIGGDQITAVSGSYNPGFPDYGSVTAVQTVGNLNVLYSTAVSYTSEFAATTTGNDLTYEAVTQNSNSYSAALLTGMGFTPPTPMLNAPGYGSNSSPSPQMECAP